MSVYPYVRITLVAEQNKAVKEIARTLDLGFPLRAEHGVDQQIAVAVSQMLGEVPVYVDGWSGKANITIEGLTDPLAD